MCVRVFTNIFQTFVKYIRMTLCDIYYYFHVIYTTNHNFKLKKIIIYSSFTSSREKNSNVRLFIQQNFLFATLIFMCKKKKVIAMYLMQNTPYTETTIKILHIPIVFFHFPYYYDLFYLFSTFFFCFPQQIIGQCCCYVRYTGEHTYILAHLIAYLEGSSRFVTFHTRIHERVPHFNLCIQYIHTPEDFVYMRTLFAGAVRILLCN